MSPLTESAQERTAFSAWISMVSGFLGLMMLPLVVFLKIMEPSDEYAEPLRTIAHDGPWFFIPGGFVIGIIAVVLGIRLLVRRGQSRTTQALARVGLITGALAIFLTVGPTIGIVLTVFKH